MCQTLSLGYVLVERQVLRSDSVSVFYSATFVVKLRFGSQISMGHTWHTRVTMAGSSRCGWLIAWSGLHSTASARAARWGNGFTKGMKRKDCRGPMMMMMSGSPPYVLQCLLQANSISYFMAFTVPKGYFKRIQPEPYTLIAIPSIIPLNPLYYLH